LFLRHLAQTSDFPLMVEVEKAKGVYMHLKNGQKMIDLISGIGVSNLGHRHPAVTKAVRRQLKKYMHLMVYGEFVQTPQVKLAEALTKTLNDPLNAVYLLNSGSEAIEGAMKLAKRYTARPEIISFKQAYHGSSHGALSIGGDEHFKQAFRPLLPGTKQLPFNQLGAVSEISTQTAAVIVEPVQGEAGVRVGEQGFLAALRQRCDETGALLIFDEIQCGMGRTGKMWAHQHFGITPDVLVTAKGLGGGMPIGAFVAPQEMMAVFKNKPILGHITTFGGHPVSAAAGAATVKYLHRTALYSRAEAKGNIFREYLQHPKIQEIRGKGLMLAVVFESFEVLKPIIDKAIEKGVLTDWFLFCDHAMRIAPPLTITPRQIRKACRLIVEAIDEAS